MTLRAFLAQHGEDVRASLAETLREAGRRGDFSDAAAARADADSSRVMKSAETSAETFRKRGRAATAAAAMLDAAGGVGGGWALQPRYVWMTRRRARRRTAASEGHLQMSYFRWRARPARRAVRGAARFCTP